MSRTLAICGALLLLQGCTHIRPHTDSFDALNERARKATATVLMVSGDTFEAEALRVTSDSTYWITPTGKAPGSAATAAVAFVSFHSRSVGAVDGMLTGLKIGGGGGFLFGAIAGIDYAEKNHVVAAALIGGLFSLFGIAWGIPTGAVGGALVGSTLEYPISTVPEPQTPAGVDTGLERPGGG